MISVLGNLPDFRNNPKLTDLVEDLGYIILLSPKCHPEVTDVRIEYSWGMPKIKFRREVNQKVPRNLHDNIFQSIRQISI